MSKAGTEQSPTFLNVKGIQMRMQCKPQVANCIKDAFVTVGQLVDAVESDKELTDFDGVGPATADAINGWWDERFEREEKARSSTFKRTGERSATVYLHQSWEDEIADRSVDAKTEGGDRDD